ncbi:MAG TPA: MBL fold metallo-hydrolase [Acidisoma sp.]|jgi:glyoxylase-like metal-dependent hydrolase (beta-lactamase superfamily II)|uniref:MBL fold metallo-hydrolase n=1 Tax=Acidisoma sp. TaxID=1872115 RepID=UPI002B71D11F|nr:MBL fold metallo-hydrolase [Acidisoma sp.]HTI02232.1 MBL fold metallo-hydrolase [Acidisoma sp.]
MSGDQENRADTALSGAQALAAQALGAPKPRPEVTAFFDEPTNTASYVIRDPRSPSCAVVDSVLDFDAAAGRTDTRSADAIIAFIRKEGLAIEWILETHVHADHLSAAPYIKERLGGRLGIGANIRVVQDIFGKVFNAGTEFQRDGSQFDHLFQDGERFTIGGMAAVALHTPGHTPACMTYVVEDAAFVGDTLFMPDFGTARADFPGGDAAMLYRSARRVLSLPEETRLFLCHDYKAPGRDTYAWETTVAAERAGNVHMHDGVTEADFVAMREARDRTLSMPKLILPSVQVNMRAGEMPPPENDGHRYLKIPINRL